MTRLFFMRHGDALPLSEAHPGDIERPLSAAGEREVMAVARHLAGCGTSLSHCFSSPRLRARQTAHIIGRFLEVAVVIDDSLDFEFDAAAAQSLAGSLRHDARVLFVGHNPSMSHVIGTTCGAHVRLRTASLACIDALPEDITQGELLWLLTPKLTLPAGR